MTQEPHYTLSRICKKVKAIKDIPQTLANMANQQWEDVVRFAIHSLLKSGSLVILKDGTISCPENKIQFTAICERAAKSVIQQITNAHAKK